MPCTGSFHIASDARFVVDEGNKRLRGHHWPAGTMRNGDLWARYDRAIDDYQLDTDTFVLSKVKGHQEPADAATEWQATAYVGNGFAHRTAIEARKIHNDVAQHRALWDDWERRAQIARAVHHLLVTVASADVEDYHTN